MAQLTIIVRQYSCFALVRASVDHCQHGLVRALDRGASCVTSALQLRIHVAIFPRRTVTLFPWVVHACSNRASHMAQQFRPMSADIQPLMRSGNDQNSRKVIQPSLTDLFSMWSSEMEVLDAAYQTVSRATRALHRGDYAAACRGYSAAA